MDVVHVLGYTAVHKRVGNLEGSRIVFKNWEQIVVKTKEVQIVYRFVSSELLPTACT